MSKKFNPLWLPLCGLLLCTAPVYAQEAAPAQKAEAAKDKPSAETLDRWVRLGKAYYNGDSKFLRQDYEKSRKSFEKAAEHNNAEALYYLGNIYQDGKGVDQDEKKAAEYYYQAANLGQPDSQMIVGVQHVMAGIDMEPKSAGQLAEYTTAVEWLKKAAEQGVPEAKYWYGDMLMKGLGTAKDEKKGERLIREAAEEGNPNGQAMYAAMFWQGLGGHKKDLVTAYKWMRLSQLGGNENAEYLLVSIARGMKAEEVAQAKKAVADALAEQGRKKGRD